MKICFKVTDSLLKEMRAIVHQQTLLTFVGWELCEYLNFAMLVGPMKIGHGISRFPYVTS